MALRGEVGNQICSSQRVAPFAGRHDGVAADGIDLSGAAAGDHAHIGVSADDGDGVQLRGVERQGVAIVLEEHDAALLNFARDFKSREGIDDTALAGDGR